MTMSIPFVDLHAQYDAIFDEVDEAMRRVIGATAFAGGPFVEQFEREFAAFCETEHSVGVGSGTEALWLALLAMGVGPGDEVITVPFTFIATAEAIHLCGATPVFVDIDEATFTMDPDKLEAAITDRTKAIVPVHLYGQSADMIPILDIASRHDVPVIEDACQAHGARYAGRRVGSLGDVGCFSFYPGKNLGAYGEAGALVTRDAAVADRARALRDHGQRAKNDHTSIGWNARMDGLQAAVLSVKLPHLDDWNTARRSAAAKYDSLFRAVQGVTTPAIAPHVESAFHLYVIRAASRDAVLNALRASDIGCGVHYPIPVHLQPAFAHLGLGRGTFPVSERCADEVLSLPIYPELTKTEIETVAACVRSAVTPARDGVGTA